MNMCFIFRSELSLSNATLRSFYPGMLISPTVIEVPRIKSVREVVKNADMLVNGQADQGLNPTPFMVSVS